MYVYSLGSIPMTREKYKLLCSMYEVLVFVYGYPLKYKSSDTVTRSSFLKFFIPNRLSWMDIVNYSESLKGVL